MKKYFQKNGVKNLEIRFNSRSIELKELEERKEMLVIWRRGEGFFPKDNPGSVLEDQGMR